MKDKLFLDKIWIIIIVILVLLIAGLGVYIYFNYYNNDNNKEAEIEQNQPNFSDEESGLEFYIPENWEELDKKGIVQYYPSAHFAFKKNDREKTIFAFAREKFPGKTNFNILGSVQTLDKALPEAISNFSKIDAKEIDIVDTKGLQYDFNYKTGGINIMTGTAINEVDMIQRKIYFLKNEYMFYFDFAAEKGNFEEDMKDLEKIINSMKINKVNEDDKEEKNQESEHKE